MDYKNSKLKLFKSDFSYIWTPLVVLDTSLLHSILINPLNAISCINPLEIINGTS